MFQYVQVPRISQASASAPSASLTPMSRAVSPSRLQAMPIGSALTQMLSNRRSGRRRNKKKGKEVHVALGNDTAPRWMPRRSVRDVAIAITASTPTATLATTAGTVQLVGLSFTASMVNQMSQLAAVFDQYCIHWIEVLIEPTLTEIVSGGANSDPGSYVTAIDTTDAAVPAAYNDVVDYEDSVQSRGNISHYHRFKPTVLLSALDSTFTSFADAEDVWVSTVSLAVQHMGLKAAFTVPPATTSYQVYTYQARFHIGLRGVR